MTHLARLLRQGSVADVPAAQALIAEARHWLHSRAIDQWQDAIPDDTIRRNANRCELFVVRSGEGITAMVTVLDSDFDTWGDQQTPALYVHRLVVAQSQRGSGCGQAILQWVAARAVAAEKSLVRLDCAADNPGLRRFYEMQGFRHVLDVAVRAPTSGRLLQSSLYERAAPINEASELAR